MAGSYVVSKELQVNEAVFCGCCCYQFFWNWFRWGMISPDLLKASPFWIVPFIVLLGFVLFDLLKMWTPELLRILCFPHLVVLSPMCHFKKHSPWDTEVMDQHLECYQSLWVALVGGIVTVLSLVQFLVYSVVCWIERTRYPTTSAHICCK